MLCPGLISHGRGNCLPFRVPTHGVRQVHLSTQTLASVNLWVLHFSPCRQLSWETETCSCIATAALARSAGQICASEGENKSAQHGKMKRGCQRILFAVAVQTTACSHFRINSHSFQLHLRMPCWTAFGGKISPAMGFLLSWTRWDHCRDQSGSFPWFVSSVAPLHARVYLTSGDQSTTFPACGVFARSRFSSRTFGDKRRRTGRPVTRSCIISLEPSDSTAREGKKTSGERTGSRCTERNAGSFRFVSCSSAFKEKSKGIGVTGVEFPWMFPPNKLIKHRVDSES